MSEVELIDIFVDNLESKMKEVGITQAELAKEAGLGKGTISRYLSRERLPNIRALVNICYVLDCNVDELVPTYDIIE